MSTSRSKSIRATGRRRNAGRQADRGFELEATLPSWVDAVLIAAGAVLQLVGFGLLLVGLRDRTRAVQRHADKSRDQTIYPDTIRAEVTLFPPRVEGGDQPSVDERLSRLEARLAEHDQEEDQRRRALRDELSGRLESLVSSVYGETRERMAGIQGLIDAITVEASPTERRAIALFAIGLALMAVGSIDAI